MSALIPKNWAVRSEAGGEWNPRRGDLSSGWDQPGDLLQLEEEVRGRVNTDLYGRQAGQNSVFRTAAQYNAPKKAAAVLTRHGLCKAVVSAGNVDDRHSMADPSFPNEITTAPIVRNTFHPQLNSTLSLVAGKLTYQILGVWQPDQVHEYLLAPDHRRHVWHCGLAKQSEITNPEEAYRFLTQAKSRDILIDGYGCCPAGLISALGKLGALARRKEFYAALVGVLKRGGPLAKHVHHLKQISDEAIFALAAINDLPPSDRILLVLLRWSKPDQFPEVTWVVSRLVQLLGQDAVDAAILAGGNPANAIRRLIGQLPFPQPPFEGDARLQPITSADDLRSTGRTFRNCLADRPMWLDSVLAVLAGRTYFYRWCGGQPILLSFSRFGSLGWVPREMFGTRNERPRETSCQQLEQVLRTIPEVGPVGIRGGMFQNF